MRYVRFSEGDGGNVGGGGGEAEDRVGEELSRQEVPAGTL